MHTKPPTARVLKHRSLRRLGDRNRYPAKQLAVFPEFNNPNRPLIMVVGCISAFSIPFAFAHSWWLAFVVALPALVYAVFSYSLIFKNWRVERRWINTLDGTMSCRAVKKRVFSNPATIRMVLKYDDWPLSFSRIRPRVMLIDDEKKRYHVKYWFPTQICELISASKRAGVLITDEMANPITPRHMQTIAG